jgi:hypothetical protein
VGAGAEVAAGAPQADRRIVKTNRTGKIRKVISRAGCLIFLLMVPPISKAGSLLSILKPITIHL